MNAYLFVWQESVEDCAQYIHYLSIGVNIIHFLGTNRLINANYNRDYGICRHSVESLTSC